MYGSNNTRSYVSVNEVIAKFLADTGHQDGDSFNKIHFLNWVGEAMLHICSPTYPIHKEAEIEVEQYQGLLPCDFYQLNQLNYGNMPLRFNGGTFTHFGNNFNNPNSDRFVFTISNYVINTNLQNGTLKISYRALPMDENGNPLINNSMSVIEAVVSYLKFRMWEAKFFRKADRETALIRGTYKQEWELNRLKATNQGMLMSLEEREHFKSMYNRLINRGESYMSNFDTMASNNRTHFENNGSR